MNRRNIIIILVIVVALVIILWLWNGSDGEPASLNITTQQSTQIFSPTKLESAVQQTTTELTTKKEELNFKTADEAKAYIKSYANEKGYKFEDYPEKLFDLVVKDRSAIGYVLDYPAEIKKEHSYELEIDSYNKVPLFIQWDTRWGYHKFKNGVVGIDGCGGTCVSMAAVYLLKDTSLTPDVISDYAADNGYFVDGSGMSWDFFSYGIKHYGLESRSLSTSKNEIVNAVQKGHPVVLSVKKGDFTRKGHYILVVGYENGKFVINDPYSKVNSEKRWSWNRIEPQIKTMWEIYTR